MRKILLEEISKEDFQVYEAVRVSGVTNMFAVNVIEDLSGLEREVIIGIMEHYSDLVKKFINVRKQRGI